MNMVEKVARALCVADGRDPDGRDMGGSVSNDENWIYYRFSARAAIEAMMEPTKEMIAAGYEKINENIDFWNYASDSGYSVDDIAPTETWQSMIQSALKEGQ